MESVIMLLLITIIGFLNVIFVSGRDFESCQVYLPGDQSRISLPALTSFLIEKEDKWLIDLRLLSEQDDLFGCLHMHTDNQSVFVEGGNCGKKERLKTNFPREAIESLGNLDIHVTSSKNVLQIQSLNSDTFAYKWNITRNEGANLYLRVNASVPYTYNCKGSCPLLLYKSSSLHQLEIVKQTVSRNMYPLQDENFLLLQTRWSECFIHKDVSSTDIISLYPLAVRGQWNQINWTVKENDLQLFIGNEMVWNLTKDRSCRIFHGIDVSSAGSVIWTFDCEPEEIQKIEIVQSSSAFCIVTSPTTSTLAETTIQNLHLALLAVILIVMLFVCMGTIVDLVLIVRLVKIEKKK